MDSEDDYAFEWDEYNEVHLGRHNITPGEVEEVFEGRIVRLQGGTDQPDRVAILGRTFGGRYLFVVYQQKARGVKRPFTGRDMRPHERRLYGRQTGS